MQRCVCGGGGGLGRGVAAARLLNPWLQASSCLWNWRGAVHGTTCLPPSPSPTPLRFPCFNACPPPPTAPPAGPAYVVMFNSCEAPARIVDHKPAGSAASASAGGQQQQGDDDGYAALLGDDGLEEVRLALLGWGW